MMTPFDLRRWDTQVEPGPTWAALRDAGPVVPLRLPILGPLLAATTYEACERLLRDPETFARNARRGGPSRLAWVQRSLPRLLGLPTTNMLAVDGADHRRLRRLVELAFTRSSVDALRPALTVLADRLIDDALAAAKSSGGTVDWQAAFARPFPLAVICELLGLPPEDRPRFTRWAHRVTTVSSLGGVLGAVPGLWGLTRYLRREIEAVRRTPRAGLLSSLVRVRDEADALSDEELLAMVFLLLLAGHETTVHLLDGALVCLDRRPDVRDACRVDPSLLPSFIDETLRHFAPVQLSKPRFVTRDATLAGEPLRRGQSVIAVLASANRDPARFADPDVFDPARSPNPHLTFGSGPHVCLGLKLARIEAEVALTRLLDRCPDVRLAVPAEELPWLKRPGLRAVARLPVRLS